jgi:hypothetical protein
VGFGITDQLVVRFSAFVRYWGGGGGSGNACYRSIQNLLSCLLLKNRKVRIYKTNILPECKTWSLTLRDEHRLRVFGDRALKRIFGPKRDEVMGRWRKLHNEELHTLYSLSSIVRMLK